MTKCAVQHCETRFTFSVASSQSRSLVPLCLGRDLRQFWRGSFKKIKNGRLMTRPVPIIVVINPLFDLEKKKYSSVFLFGTWIYAQSFFVFDKIFLFADSYLYIYILCPSSLKVCCFQFFHYRNPLNPRTAL